MNKPAIFHLITSHGDEYHVGNSWDRTVKVTKTEAENFIGKCVLAGANFSKYVDPDTGDEFWEAE